MSVKSLIDRVSPYASGWSRTGTRSILNLIEQGQDELLDCTEPQRIFISTDNKGFPSYLTTVDETYKYEIINANLSATLTRNIGGTDRVVRAKKILRVFIDVSESYDYTGHWIGEPALDYYINPYSTNTDRIKVAKIPVDSYDALEDTPAWIQFRNNPGATTDKFFVEFTWEAPRLVSESIPLVVPLEYEKALRDFVLGEIQFYENGAQNALQASFEKYWKPRFRALQRSGARSDNYQTIPVVC